MIEDILTTLNFPPVLLLFGDDDYTLEQDAERLFQAASASDTGGMSTDVVDGDGMQADAIVSLARSFPMMSTRRTIWVKHFDRVTPPRGKNASVLLGYLQNPSSSTFLLLTASVPQAAGLTSARQRGSAAFKRKLTGIKQPFTAIFQSATWHEYPAKKHPQLLAWVHATAEQNHFAIDRDAAEILIARCGSSQRMLALELEKVALFLEGKPQATARDIVRLTSGSQQFTVFDLQRAIGRNNPAEAIRILQPLVDHNHEEMLILTMLARYFTQLLKLTETIRSADASTAATAAGIQPFALGEYQSALSALGSRKIEKGIHAIRHAERLLKSSTVDAFAVLQAMVVSILDDDSRDFGNGLEIFAA